MSDHRYGQQPVASSSSSALIADTGILDYGSTTRALKDQDVLIERNIQPEGESFDDVPAERRQIGVLSAVSLIFNRMIGTGIYATPSLILRASGSVGMFLLMWVLGAIIAAVGMAVYVEFGTALPRSGGEKNYLEYIYRKPKLLVTCAFATYTCLSGWSAPSAVVFGEYMVHAFGGQITQWNTRVVGFACVTAATLLHVLHLKWGLRLQNTLAIAKIGFMLFIIFSGFVAFMGWIHIDNRPHNFDKFWEGTTRDPNAFVSGLYNVIWSFIGYSNAHYALSETKDPVKILKRSAPLAMILITVMYLFVNVSYLLVVPKEEIMNSGRVIAALFFRNIFGTLAERVLSIMICISTLGNILSLCFTQSRLIQELGREGALPFSSVFSSSMPFNTPLAGLALQWTMSTLWMFGPPPGDAYNFSLNIHSYPYSWINFAISGGLLWLYLAPPQSEQHEKWDPPFRAGIPVIALFLISNLFLVVAPLIPPSPGFSLYEHLPYWLHVAATGLIVLVGVIYWYVWTKALPRLGGYKIVPEVVIQDDGVSRVVLKKVS